MSETRRGPDALPQKTYSEVEKKYLELEKSANLLEFSTRLFQNIPASRKFLMEPEFSFLNSMYSKEEIEVFKLVVTALSGSEPLDISSSTLLEDFAKISASNEVFTKKELNLFEKYIIELAKEKKVIWLKNESKHACKDEMFIAIKDLVRRELVKSLILIENEHPDSGKNNGHRIVRRMRAGIIDSMRILQNTFQDDFLYTTTAHVMPYIDDPIQLITALRLSVNRREQKTSATAIAGEIWATTVLKWLGDDPAVLRISGEVLVHVAQVDCDHTEKFETVVGDTETARRLLQVFTTNNILTTSTDGSIAWNETIRRTLADPDGKKSFIDSLHSATHSKK